MGGAKWQRAPAPKAGSGGGEEGIRSDYSTTLKTVKEKNRTSSAKERTGVRGDLWLGKGPCLTAGIS